MNSICVSLAAALLFVAMAIGAVVVFHLLFDDDAPDEEDES